MRNLRTEQKRRDHLSVFREFLSHLDRVGRRASGAKNTKPPKRGGKRR
jgi:hypothetical protein